MDVLRLRAVAGLHPDAVPPLQRALLRRRLPRPAGRIVGGRAEHDPAVLPQLGAAHPTTDLLRRTAGMGHLTCAVTSPGSARPGPWPRWSWTHLSGCCGSRTLRGARRED